MRPELQSLHTALHHLAALMGTDPEPFDEIALGLDATLDAHLQRIERLEARCAALAQLNQTLVDILDSNTAAIEALERQASPLKLSAIVDRTRAAE